MVVCMFVKRRNTMTSIGRLNTWFPSRSPKKIPREIPSRTEARVIQTAHRKRPERIRAIEIPEAVIRRIKLGRYVSSPS